MDVIISFGIIMVYLMLYLIFPIILGLISEKIGKKKGIHGFWWGFWLGIIGILIVSLKEEEKNVQTSNNKYDDLIKLQTLKESGAITEEEFGKEKTVLLETAKENNKTTIKPKEDLSGVIIDSLLQIFGFILILVIIIASISIYLMGI